MVLWNLQNYSDSQPVTAMDTISPTGSVQHAAPLQQHAAASKSFHPEAAGVPHPPVHRSVTSCGDLGDEGLEVFQSKRY